MFDLEKKQGEVRTNKYDVQIINLLSNISAEIGDSIRNNENKELGFKQMKKLLGVCEKVVDIEYKQKKQGSLHGFWDPAGYDYQTNHQIVKHSTNVGIGITRLDIKQGMSKRDIVIDLFSAIQHDLGKWVYEDLICSGEGLSQKEYMDMEKHPIEGYFMSKLGLDKMVAKNILSESERKNIEYAQLDHQQRYNGSGYPTTIAGENIPYNAQRIQAVDTTDAATTFRGYNTPKTIEQTIGELHRCAGSQFSPRAVEEITGMPCEHTDNYKLEKRVENLSKNKEVPRKIEFDINLSLN